MVSNVCVRPLRAHVEAADGLDRRRRRSRCGTARSRPAGRCPGCRREGRSRRAIRPGPAACSRARRASRPVCCGSRCSPTPSVSRLAASASGDGTACISAWTGATMKSGGRVSGLGTRGCARRAACCCSVHTGGSRSACDLVAGGTLAGDGLEGAEQLGRLAAEQLQVVAGVVGLVQVGGDVQQRPAELPGERPGQNRRKGSPQPVRDDHPPRAARRPRRRRDTLGRKSRPRGRQFANPGQKGTERAVAVKTLDDVDHTQYGNRLSGLSAMNPMAGFASRGAKIKPRPSLAGAYRDQDLSRLAGVSGSAWSLAGSFELAPGCRTARE